jgi:hypothetical protein
MHDAILRTQSKAITLTVMTQSAISNYIEIKNRYVSIGSLVRTVNELKAHIAQNTIT